MTGTDAKQAGGSERSVSMPLGIVLRRTPGVTRWAAYAWQAVAVLPGAPVEQWKELRREGEAVEYHADTLTLELHRAEAEAYRTGLSAARPSVFVVLDRDEGPHGIAPRLVTASPYEAQDYADSGEEQIEAVPMPASLGAWIEAFVARHYVEEPFVKRKRNRKRVDLVETGVGDARIAKAADVYASPRLKREARG